MGLRLNNGNTVVEVLKDSIIQIAGYTHRLTTFCCVYPRIILAEVNTHRALSRNSASLRALSVEQVVELLRSNPFIPDRFPKSHKGMVANGWIEKDSPYYPDAVSRYIEMMESTISFALKFASEFDVSQQIASRPLAPYMMQTSIISATEWGNFIRLREEKNAQWEIQVLAKLILEALNTSTPTILEPGEWHIPFDERYEVVEDSLDLEPLENSVLKNTGIPVKALLSAGDCARVSYLSQGQKSTQDNLKLAVRLANNGHMSPFEHVAQAMTPWQYGKSIRWTTDGTDFGWCGNVRGFRQVRAMIPGENRRDPRIKI